MCVNVGDCNLILLDFLPCPSVHLGLLCGDCSHPSVSTTTRERHKVPQTQAYEQENVGNHVNHMNRQTHSSKPTKQGFKQTQ